MRSILPVLTLALLAPALVSAAEPSCPIQLEESRTHALLVAQSREQLELRLAQAIRSNHELSALADKLVEKNKALADELAALKPKPEEAKPEAAKP